MSCGYHGRVNDRQPGVRVEWSSVEDGGKCLLMLDERFELDHRLLQMVKEMLALLLEVEGLVTGR